MKSNEQQLQLQIEGLQLQIEGLQLQNKEVLRQSRFTTEHNIVLRGKLAIAQTHDTALRRIFNTLFHGEYAADYILRAVIIGIREGDPKSVHLATLNRIHDQVQDVRNITRNIIKGENYE